mgnify:CR=1 FL=1
MGVPMTISGIIDAGNPREAEMEIENEVEATVETRAYYTQDQETAIATVDRPVLVVAPAGTGKTTIITSKYQRIVQNHGPKSVVAITFTRKAAKEIRDRVILQGDLETPLTKQQARDAFIGTFHAIGSIVLRKAKELKLYNGPTTLATEDDMKVHAGQAMRSVPGAINETLGRARTKKDSDRALKSLIDLVDRIKNMGWLPIEEGYRDATDAITPIVPGLPVKGSTNHAMAVAYQDALYASGNLDYNDIILYATSVLEGYRDAIFPQVGFVLVDEYQDTNSAQEKFINALARDIHLTCVGDDDQSIYGWRGAKVENMTTFEARRPDAVRIELVNNYRSTPDILDMAKRIIARNSGRIDKTATAKKEVKPGDGVEIHDIAKLPGASKLDVASLKTDFLPKVVSEICLELLNEGALSRDIGIIVRSNAEADAIVNRLNGMHVNARISSPNGVNSNELRHLTAWLRVLTKPSDVSAAAVLTRSHSGDNAFMDVVTAANMAGKPVMEFLAQRAAEGRLRQENFLEAGRQYAAMLDIAAQGDDAATLNAACELALKVDKKMRDSHRESHYWTIFVELTNILLDGGKFSDCIEALQQRLTDDDTYPDDVEPPVEVSTVHSMKGRQKPILIVSAFIDGVMPMNTWSAPDKEKALAEERRLAYVAITRARNQLHIITSSSHPSRFAAECGAVDVMMGERKGAA